MHAFPKLEPVLEGRTSFEEPSGTLPGTGYQRTEEYVVDDKIIALLSAKDDATHSPLAVASLKRVSRDFPGDLVVKNLPSSAGDTGFTPHWET